MKKIIDKDTWNRKELFNYYDGVTNPFLYLTTTIEITNLYKYVKDNNLPFYPTFGYYITKALNQIDGFKYRKEGSDIAYYDTLNTNFTDNVNGERIFFFTVPFSDDFNKFLDDYKVIKEKYFKNEVTDINYQNNEVWLSCAPWMKITGLITPYNKDNSIPQVIWDKFEFDGDKVKINMVIMVHHGFVDGFQIGKFISLLTDSINCL